MIAWREKCETALRAMTEADAIRFWGKSHPGPDGPRPVFDYRFEHTLAVVKIARWLAPQVGADPEIVECAAWLHDCRKYLNHHKEKDTHAQDASAAVEEILADTDFPRAKIPAVRHAIEHHVGLKLTRKLEPVETACLWDADKLSKIGAASLIHFVCIAGGFEPIHTAEVIARGERWMERAQAIAASMNTKPARKEAERRVAFLAAHYRQLRREWNDPMKPTP
ncbi:MAG: HD domain-containing protein [Holophaga sp.]|jgi:uncharacterized protein